MKGSKLGVGEETLRGKFTGSSHSSLFPPFLERLSESFSKEENYRPVYV